MRVGASHSSTSTVIRVSPHETSGGCAPSSFEDPGRGALIAAFCVLRPGMRSVRAGEMLEAEPGLRSTDASVFFDPRSKTLAPRAPPSFCRACLTQPGVRSLSTVFELAHPAPQATSQHARTQWARRRMNATHFKRPRPLSSRGWRSARARRDMAGDRAHNEGAVGQRRVARRFAQEQPCPERAENRLQEHERTRFGRPQIARTLGDRREGDGDHQKAQQRDARQARNGQVRRPRESARRRPSGRGGAR